MMHKSTDPELSKYIDRMYQRMVGREELAAKYKTVDQIYKEGK